MLLAAPLTDEVCAALALLNLDELGEGAGAAGLAVMALAAPQAFGLLVEARLLLWAARRPTRFVLAGAMVCTALGYLVVAGFPEAMALAFVVMGVSEGLAVGIAQAAAVARAREEGVEEERVLTRWALGAAAGDLLGPVLAAGLAALGFGWRGAFVVAAAWLAAHAFAALWAPLPPLEEEEEPPGDLRALLAAVRADPGLALALAGAVSCALLDEILLLFGVLWLAERGVPPEARALAFGGLALGLTLGTAALEPALRRASARTLTLVSAVATTVTYTAWLTTAHPAWLLLTGLAAAPLYPLAEARAYAGRSPVLVAAASRLAGLAEVLLPVGVGLVAASFGLRAALVVLLVQPVLLGVLAGRERAP